MLTGNGAAAWGARLSDIDYVPAFPITPQTEIIESIAAWIETGEMATRMVTLESEHSMITAAGAAAATGVRVFTATSSQGLLYGLEMVYTVGAWRVPFVLVNVSRGLSAPITLEPDHNDVLAARDTGFLQIHCATCQEVLDSILIGYRLAEDERVRLPVIVNLDGFYLSFTREPVEIPEADSVRSFLPPFDPEGIQFRASRPSSQAVAVLGGGTYSYFRYETHLAATNALHAVDRLRAAGSRVGLVRPRLLRPYPVDEMRRVLAGKKGVAVVDQNLSVGKGGVLHTELASALYGVPDAPAVLVSFVGGLGGRDISREEFYEMAAVTRKAVDEGRVPEPRLLYTEEELRELRKLQAIAVVEREEGKE
jgi:pyruvate ferredoxin oxidoreductase alpha subunit